MTPSFLISNAKERSRYHLTQSPVALLKTNWGDMNWVVGCWLRDVLVQLPWSP